ncbi:hypothetical protein ACJDU8_00525 [Clostridium sp. WILCCON 0269]|uniref:SAF domain-containing protein n=1 Tax=Candidatus Clostridium eludens TaxID=3381663 RepID=A0ABW8SDM0_9CLOT
MKKSKIVILILIISIIVSSIYFGVKTKQSFKDDMNFNNITWIDDMNVNILYEPNDNTDMSFANIYYNDKIDTVNDLNEKSILIAKVRPTDPNQRLNLLQTILTKVEILNVYKGNYKKGEKIYIYEPSYISLLYKTKQSTYASFNCYNLMLNDKEYIVFLKKPKYPNGYKLKDREKISFMFINPLLGKYSVDSDKNTSLLSKEELNKIKYGSIKKYDIVTTSKETLDKYNIFRDGIEKQYIINQ